MIVTIVRYKSGLTDDEVLRLYESRAPQYRQVPGLRQKYYLRYRETGEHGAVYVWDSEAALAAFQASPLGRSIGDVYRVQGKKTSERCEVVLALR
jgi:heme-degrading monooxygenase HmoA